MKDNKDSNDIILDNSDIDDSVVAEENATEAIKKLRAKLKACETEKSEYLTGWQRSKADLINARKRDEEDRKNFIRLANADIIEEFLGVLGSFDMAMNNKEAWEKVDKSWRLGVEYIYSQFKKVLTDHDLEEIDPVGQPFDHHLHEAVSHESVTEEKLNNMVIKVIQKGYKLGDRLIRPAKVVVGLVESK